MSIVMEGRGGCDEEFGEGEKTLAASALYPRGERMEGLQYRARLYPAQ